MSPEAWKRLAPSTRFRRERTGFTLIELLVVMLIIMLISAVALPVILPALNHRQVSESARILQGALVGARDAAVHANAPRGIRLLPDPNLITFVTDPKSPLFGQVDQTQMLAANRIVALEPAPDYSEGRLNVRCIGEIQSLFLSLPYPYEGRGSWPYNGPDFPSVPVLVVEEAITDQDKNLAAYPSANIHRSNPTSWFWNVRVGDKLQIGNAGDVYTVVGPMTIGPSGGNAELFVNIGLPGQAASPLIYPDQPDSLPAHEFLFLVNGFDDNKNGLVDEGFDGVDNNLDGAVDNITTDSLVSEWEPESWLGALATENSRLVTGGPWQTNLPYTIHRRPTPSANAREASLPSNVVVDLTTWARASPERSRAPVNPYTGAVDIMLTPQGEVLPNTIFSAPSSFRLADAFFHFWLSERGDLYSPADFKITGPAPANTDGNPQSPPFLPVPAGYNPNTTTILQGENRLLTLYTRNGQMVINEVSGFDENSEDYNTATNGNANYNPSFPFIRAQQGVRGAE